MKVTQEANLAFPELHLFPSSHKEVSVGITRRRTRVHHLRARTIQNSDKSLNYYQLGFSQWCITPRPTRILD